MDRDVEIIKENIEKFLMESEEHNDKKIDYLLFNKANNEYYAVATDKYEEEMIGFSNELEQDGEYQNVPDWDFNFDTYFFEYLKKGYEIEFMTNQVHYGIWLELEKCYPYDYESLDGVQKYLEYCKKNNITKEYLDKELNKDDTPNVMNYLEKDKTQDKIQDNNSDIAYFTFVLGYEMLNDMLTNSRAPECDICYEFCDIQARKFIDSKYYQDNKKSSYDALRNWVNDNYEIIKSNFLQYSSIDYKIILDKGVTKDMPVALVEIAGGLPNEYVIAFNYKVTNEKTDWSYGIFYDDKQKALDDFRKVLDGRSIDMTFNDKKKGKEDLWR